MTTIAQTATASPPATERAARIRFCTRCAATEPDGQLAPYGFNRVCSHCGMGVMLSAPSASIASSGAAFLVVTREGRISAVSEPAEYLVGEEAGLLGMPVTTAVTCPDGDEHLVRCVARAAGGGRETPDLAVTAAVRASGKYGRLGAHVVSCGPPRAALVVLERAQL